MEVRLGKWILSTLQEPFFSLVVFLVLKSTLSGISVNIAAPSL